MNIRKEITLLMMSMAFSSTFFGEVFAAPRLDWHSADFEGLRVIAESAWKTEYEAKKRGEELHFKYGFQNLGILWIPYYRNLSGKSLYQTIIVPEGNCDRFLQENIRRINCDAYCFTPSNRGLAPNRRGGRIF
ncbi:MAG: hypothetical protein EWV82_20400 [Microcystis aeruginosa Ma_AC_P_19900807_S299]|nr:MAG: hypothetical protein EWV82_20400 [Microcystis aeruginosa Ma_AC_P_19900807_S299]